MDARTAAADFDPNQPRDPQGRWANGGLTGAGALPTEPAKINQIAAQPGSRSQSPLASVLSFINPISSAAAQEMQQRQTAPVVLAAHIHEEPPEDEKQLQEQIRELGDPVRGGPRTRPDGTVSLTPPSIPFEQTPAAVARGFAGRKSAQTWQNQMIKRGWTAEQIEEAVHSGESFGAPNKINPGNVRLGM